MGSYTKHAFTDVYNQVTVKERGYWLQTERRSPH